MSFMCFSYQIWILLQSTPPDELLEESHGSIPAVHRSHPRYGELVLAYRAFLNAVRPLFRAPKEEPRTVSLKRKLAALELKQPIKRNGCSELCGFIAKAATKQLPEGATKSRCWKRANEPLAKRQQCLPLCRRRNRSVGTYRRPTRLNTRRLSSPTTSTTSLPGSRCKTAARKRKQTLTLA